MSYMPALELLLASFMIVGMMRATTCFRLLEKFDRCDFG